jgi:hypothetical protein
MNPIEEALALDLFHPATLRFPKLGSLTYFDHGPFAEHECQREDAGQTTRRASNRPKCSKPLGQPLEGLFASLTEFSGIA